MKVATITEDQARTLKVVCEELHRISTLGQCITLLDNLQFVEQEPVSIEAEKVE